MTEQSGLILLVEDDPSLRRSLLEFLHDHGYQTLAASTVREAAELLKTSRPALCLLDLNLPDGNGMELFHCAAIQTAQTRVIVMTAFPLQHLRPADANGSLVAWMTKPVAPSQLLQALRAGLQHAAATSTKSPQPSIE